MLTLWKNYEDCRIGLLWICENVREEVVEGMNRIIISNIPKISAIYFALLQCGYDYYSMGRNEEHIEALERYRDDRIQIEFFMKVKQDFCEVYPYWPRAALLETASFYIMSGLPQYEAYNALYEHIMSAENITDQERNQKFWDWIADFPDSLYEILSNDTFRNYFAWETEWIVQQNAEHEKELQKIQECLEVCVNKYDSPVQDIQIVINPIKCIYSADYHFDNNRFVFCSGEFKMEFIIHEILHHIVHPVIIAHKKSILSRNTEKLNLDDSYYLSGNDEGHLNAFEEYVVRELTKDIMEKKYPLDITEYVKYLLR